MIIVRRPNLKVLKQFQVHGIPIWFAGLHRKDDQPVRIDFPSQWQRSSTSRFDLTKTPASGAFAVITGHRVDVIDVDTKNGADPDDMHRRLLEAGVPIIAVTHTPSGGKHFYISSVGIRSRKGIEEGVDLLAGDEQGEGRSCAFAPGTVRPEYPEGGYTWEQEPDWSLLGVDVDKARAFVHSMKKKDQAKTIQALKPPATAVESSDLLDRALLAISSAEVGSRNHTLYRETTKMACTGMLTPEAQDLIAEAALTSGLTHNEIHTTIESADQAGKTQRALVMQWRDAVLSSIEHRKVGRPSVRHSVIAFAEKFAEHGPDNLGFSCRELALEINMTAKTSSLAIKTLLKYGYIKKVAKRCTADSLGKSYRYSMTPTRTIERHAEQDPKATRSVQEKLIHPDGVMQPKGNNHSEDIYIGSSTSDDCYLFDVSPERISQIHAHGAFTRLGREVSLPPKLANTLAAIEAGRTSVSGIVAVTGVRKAATRRHLKILQSMGLITYDAQKTRKVIPEWDGDLLDELEDWCQLKAVSGRKEYMKQKFLIESTVNARKLRIYLEVTQRMEKEMSEESENLMHFGVTRREALERRREGLAKMRRLLDEECRLDMEKMFKDSTFNKKYYKKNTNHE